MADITTNTLLTVNEAKTTLVVTETETQLIINEEDGTQIVVPDETSFQIISDLIQGPPGRDGLPGVKGDKGDPGVNAFYFTEEEFLVDNGVNQTYNLNQPPIVDSVGVFLNGIRQPKTYYELVIQPSGSRVIMQPIAMAYPGDTITISYYYAME